MKHPVENLWLLRDYALDWGYEPIEMPRKWLSAEEDIHLFWMAYS